ncbi:MAG: hypothetical protein ACXAEU_26245 [Candidatus Hodarchaeales archaeon]
MDDSVLEILATWHELLLRFPLEVSHVDIGQKLTFKNNRSTRILGRRRMAGTTQNESYEPNKFKRLIKQKHLGYWFIILLPIVTISLIVTLITADLLNTIPPGVIPENFFSQYPGYT